MLLRESRLTFERIAHEWARELDDAKNPGRLNRDEIFLNMVRGVWHGQFVNMVLTIERALRDDKDGQLHKPAPGPITREVLDKVVLVRQGARQRDPAASRWEFRASLKLEDYDPLSLRAYLEPLTISKEDFDRWCDEQGHQRPRFWFGPRSAPVEKEPEHHPLSVDELRLRSKAKRDWYARLVKIGQTQEPNTRNTKKKLFEHAKNEISQRAFDRLWEFAMPDKFKDPGARRTGS